jgi:hypothetical protein
VQEEQGMVICKKCAFKGLVLVLIGLVAVCLTGCSQNGPSAHGPEKVYICSDGSCESRSQPKPADRELDVSYFPELRENPPPDAAAVAMDDQRGTEWLDRPLETSEYGFSGSANFDRRPDMAERIFNRAVDSGVWYGVNQALGGGPAMAGILFAARQF